MELSEARHLLKYKIRNIIFDWGGVLTDLHMDLTEEGFKKLGCKDINRLHEKGPAEIFIPFELGEITPVEFHQRLKQFMGDGVDDSSLDMAWNAMLGELPPQRWHLLKRLMNSYRTFLLSNTNIIHLDYYVAYLSSHYETYGFTPVFERTYFSFQLGMRKPNADVFEYVIRQNRLSVHETLFIDDTEANIITAERLGLHAFHLRAPLDVVDLFEGI